jgi:GT2 family glycosyltransferase
VAAGNPSVYCIVLNWNGGELLSGALDSLRRIASAELKVVVVDNGSTDGSQKAARDRYPGIVLLENGSNLGFGEGNNVGIRYALERGAGWILLLNNDVVVAQDMVSELMKVAESDPSIGILAPKIYFQARPDSIWYAGGKVNYWTGIVSHRGLRQQDHGQFDRVEDTGYITGCAMLIRREVLERVGLFDPIYFPAYSEDADLSMRALRAGYRLVYVPGARLWHNISASSGGVTSPLKTRLKVEHNLIFFKRYARWYHWLTIPWCVGGVGILFVLNQLIHGNVGSVVALGKGFLRAIGRLFASRTTPPQ